MAELEEDDVPDPLELDASWFHAFMSHSPMTAFVKDAEGRLLYINPAFAKAFDFGERDWYAKTDHELWDRETADQLRANDLQILARDEPVSIAETVIQADGEHSWITVKFPFEDRSGRRYLAGIGVDMTAQRKMQEAVAQANRVESIGRLAGGIAHDFNNLLTIILACCELARFELVPPELGEYVDRIQGAAKRAADLTQRLLGYARRQAVQPRTLATNTTIRELLPLVRRLLPESIELAVELGQDTKICMDPNQLEQILINLIVNARDAISASGEIRLTSGASTRVSPGGERARYAWIRVADTGTGIPDAIVDQIFEPFYTTKPIGEGTGLGLSTCLGIVEQNLGLIELDTEEGRGTIFTVLFPQVEGPLSKASGDQASGGQARGQVVLVAEDEDEVRRVIVTSLRKQGYEVIETASAEEALERAAERPDVELLVSDMIMRGKNGVELQRRMRATHPRLRTLFISGYATAALADPSGASDCPMLSKPFTPSALLAAVAAVLDDDAGAKDSADQSSIRPLE